MRQTLLPIFPETATPINSLLSFEKKEGVVWYFHACLPVYSHEENDYKSFRLQTSQMVDLGQCTQMEIVRAFGVSSISVKRWMKKFREGGPSAFFTARKAKRSTVWTPDVLNRAQELLDQGQSREAVADILEIKQDTFYRAVHHGCLAERKKKARPTRANEA